MSKTTPIEPSYYVLCNISTFPICVPLQDYLRKYQKTTKNITENIIKETWKTLHQTKGQASENITICCNPEEWESISSEI